MGLSETMADFSNEIIKKAEENKKNGIPDAYNDMLEELRKKLSEAVGIFLKKSILLPPKNLRDIKPRDKRSKRQKRLEEKRKNGEVY